MKATKSITGLIAITLMAGSVIMFSACEKDKDEVINGLEEAGFFDSDFDSEFDRETEKDQELSPQPASASIDKVGDVRTFRVTGGNKPYTWAVGSSAAGTLDKTTTVNDIQSVKYTAAAVKANTIVITDALGRAAIIEVTAGTKALSVSPTTVSFLATELAAGQSVQFAPSGGVTPYSWSDSLPAFGSVDGNGLWTTLAQPASSWSNKTVTITLQDSDGSTVTATITAN